jgi:hypothetical protein
MDHVTITRNNTTVILGITPPPTGRGGGRPESKRAERPAGTAILKAALGHPLDGKPA